MVRNERDTEEHVEVYVAVSRGIGIQRDMERLQSGAQRVQRKERNGVKESREAYGGVREGKAFNGAERRKRRE